jgi:VWFA-related protein
VTSSSNRLVCRVVAAVIALAPGARTPAQEPAPQPQPRPTFRSTADVVHVEASVLDRDRRPVRGLTAADFTVLEDGRERPVVVFAPVELPAAGPAAAVAARWVRDAPRDVVDNRGADSGRLVVIVFDWSIRFYDQQLARRIGLAAIDGLGPDDRAAVLFTKPGSAAGKPQGFTADRALLRAAVMQPFAVARTDPHPDFSMRIMDPDGHESGDCFCGACTLDTLTRLGQTLRTVSSRPKVVLFVGTYVRTQEAMRAVSIPPIVPGKITPTFANMTGATDCPGRLTDARDAFERSMGEANVTVHVLDPVGVDTEVSSPLGPARMKERRDSLPVIADMTGGRTVGDTSAPESHVAAILDESRAYYVLGFTPAPPGRRNATRRIEVRVRSGLTVEARTHYSLADESMAATRGREPLKGAVSDALPARDVPLALSAVPMIAGSRIAAVLVARVGAETARPAAVLGAALTPFAVPVTSRRLAIPPAGGGGGSGALGLVSSLALEPGSYEIRLATESPGLAAGSVYSYVDVPDFRRAPLSMSGVLVHVAPEEPAAPRPEIDGVLPFVPTARRAFVESDTVSAFVQVSQGTTRDEPLRPVALRLRVNDVQDATLRTEAGTLALEQFAKNRTANARFALPLRGLPPGQYLLTIEAEAGERRAARAVRFEKR